MSETSIISLTDHIRIREVTAFIESNCCGPREMLTIKSLSKRFAICPTRLKALFKKQHNRSIHQYILMSRMQHAGENLLHQNATIVASKCGYNDYGNFCRDFKKIMGTRPSNFYSERKLKTEQLIHLPG
jgi:YesN/AraC family two-component response regulator